MIDTQQLMCCGITEVNDLHTNKDQLKTLKELINQWYTPGGKVRTPIYNYYDANGKYLWAPKVTYTMQERAENWSFPSFIVFSQICDATYGDELAALIAQHNLGEVLKTEPNVNPNSDNPVTVFVWRVNIENFLKLAREWAEAKKAKTKKAKVA